MVLRIQPQNFPVRPKIQIWGAVFGAMAGDTLTSS
jgi:hypothetical protein